MDKRSEISNKLILIWFSDCSSPVKSGFVQFPFYSFWGNWVLEIVIKRCHNFWICIFVILPNNTHKDPTVPIWQLSLSTRVLLQWGGLTFFLKCCHYFRDSTPCYAKWFNGFCYTSTWHKSTNNLTSFKGL